MFQPAEAYIFYGIGTEQNQSLDEFSIGGISVVFYYASPACSDKKSYLIDGVNIIKVERKQVALKGIDFHKKWNPTIAPSGLSWIIVLGF